MKLTFLSLETFQSVAIRKMNLRKLLQIFYAQPSLRRALLRGDIRQQRDRELGVSKSNGGDFFGPFWTDAKDHIAGKAELRERTPIRLQSLKNAKRLYPLLQVGFLTWWDETRRWKNEKYFLIEQSVKAQHEISEIDCIVKIENLIALKISDETNKIIYPYFSEKPALGEEAARVGLYILGEALKPYIVGDMRILDVLRGKSYAIIDTPLQGNERDIFLARYKEALADWNKLSEDY